jgi:hypothetical protein
MHAIMDLDDINSTSNLFTKEEASLFCLNNMAALEAQLAQDKGEGRMVFLCFN